MSDPMFTGPGFAVEPLSIATQGLVQTAIAYEGVDLTPRPPVRPGRELAEQRLGERYGVDLDFPGDFVVLGSGDLALTAGLEGLRACFARGVVTSPAELFWRPRYGVGATEFLGRPRSAANLSELRNRIQATLIDHVSVDEIRRLEVSTRPNVAMVEVETQVIVAGREQSIGLRIREE